MRQQPAQSFGDSAICVEWDLTLPQKSPQVQGPKNNPGRQA